MRPSSRTARSLDAEAYSRSSDVHAELAYAVHIAVVASTNPTSMTPALLVKSLQLLPRWCPYVYVAGTHTSVIALTVGEPRHHNDVSTW
jgi:hypothetical protein